MPCLKCGKETKDNQVFCAHCLSIMEAYPVKSDAHVHLPHRTTKPPVRRPWLKRRSMSADEQLQLAKKTVRLLTCLVVLLMLITIFIGAVLAHTLSTQNNHNLGRNYTYENTGD